MTERLYLPKNIKVGGMQYEIVYPYKRDNELIDGMMGLCDHINCRILVAESVLGVNISTNRIVDVLIHESMHLIDNVWFNQVLEEEDVNVLGRMVYQLLVDNTLNIYNNKFKNINKLKLGGSIYKIKYIDYNLDITDNDNQMYSCSVLSNIINIRNKVNNKTLSNQLTIVHILASAVHALVNEFSVNGESALCTIDLDVLSQAIYGLLVNNNIEGLIEKYCR